MPENSDSVGRTFESCRAYHMQPYLNNSFLSMAQSGCLFADKAQPLSNLERGCFLFYNAPVIRTKFFLRAGAVLIHQERPRQLRVELRHVDAGLPCHSVLYDVLRETHQGRGYFRSCCVVLQSKGRGGAAVDEA